MKKLSIFLSFIFACYFANSQTVDLTTFYEKSGFKSTPRYDATIEYCKKLEQNSKMVKYTTFGKSPQGRDLPLLIVDKNGYFDVESVKKSGKVVLLVQACIHAGESDGKDAGLMLVRDIVTNKKFENLIDNVTILFIPIYSVDGHERFGEYNRINQNGPTEMGWRVTAQNYNLNRDYVKADAPETKAWLTLFNKWLPDFFIDCHVTDGADYQYTMTYGLEIYGNMVPALTKWTEDVYLNQVEALMNKAGLPISPYVQFRTWHDPRSGLISGVAPPMLSQGYTAIQNRSGLLIETHMLKDYKTRVSSNYEMLKNSLLVFNKDAANLIKINKEADSYVASKAFRETGIDLSFEVTKDSIIYDFLGVEYDSRKSDLTGGDWFIYDNKKPVTFKIPFFNKNKVKYNVKLPEAYIIAPEWLEVIERLENHGVKFKRLAQPATITVKSYKFKNMKWANAPYEGRFKTKNIEFDEIEEQRTYPVGSVLIDMNQRTAKVIAHILEPKAPDSYVSWGFFNGIFQQKEYGETYVLETLARKMLAEDEKLKAEFEQKMKDDKDFATNSWEILNWFYNKSVYRDSKYNVYPVGKIYDAQVVNNLQK